MSDQTAGEASKTLVSGAGCDKCRDAAPAPRVLASCRACGSMWKNPAAREDGHHCHADGCNVPVPPKMMMCKRHWFMVPKALRDRVWATYVPGQERRKDPTPEYMEAQRAAVRAVAEKEGRANVR